MNPLLEQRIELLAEQGDVEELVELFRQSVELGRKAQESALQLTSAFTFSTTTTTQKRSTIPFAPL